MQQLITAAGPRALAAAGHCSAVDACRPFREQPQLMVRLCQVQGVRHRVTETAAKRLAYGAGNNMYLPQTMSRVLLTWQLRILVFIRCRGSSKACSETMCPC